MSPAPEPGTTLFRFATDTQAFTAGQTIFRAGDAGDYLYVVQQGEIELRVHDRVGDRRCRPQVLPRQVFGDRFLRPKPKR